MKQQIQDHKAHTWTRLLTTFLYRFEELIANFNDVAEGAGEEISDTE